MKSANDTNKIPSKQIPSKVQKFIFPGLIGILFVLVFTLNKLFPLYSDDYLYSFVYNSEPLVRINSFSDITQSQINHYLEWGGRSVVHFIAQFLLWIDNDWADILNSLAYVIFVIVIYLICNKKQSANVLLFILLIAVLWLFLPTPTGTILWITGSSNYLWGTLIVLLFLYSYYSYYISEKGRDSIFKCILFFLAGIVSGWTNENIFVGQVFFILCLIFLLRNDGLKMPKWAIYGLIGVCIGGIIMLMAPGNFIRSGAVNISLELTDKSLLYNILYRVGKVLHRYLLYILPLSVLYLFTLFLYVKRTNKDSINKTVIIGSLLFFTSAHVAWVIMCASPIFPPRATFSIISFIVIGLGILYANMNFREILYRRLNIFSVGVFTVIFAIVYIAEYRDIKVISTTFEQRKNFLLEQKKEGNRNIIFRGSILIPDRYQFEDLSQYSEKGYNKIYADYYDLDSVKVVP